MTGAKKAPERARLADELAPELASRDGKGCGGTDRDCTWARKPGCGNLVALRARERPRRAAEEVMARRELGGTRAGRLEKGAMGVRCGGDRVGNVSEGVLKFSNIYSWARGQAINKSSLGPLDKQ